MIELFRDDRARLPPGLDPGGFLPKPERRSHSKKAADEGGLSGFAAITFPDARAGRCRLRVLVVSNLSGLI